jgi:nucleotide-binding universal stress UspA family protein
MSEPSAAASVRSGPPIVVGIDGSESSVDALDYALDLAEALGRPVEAIAVWHMPPFVYGGYYPLMDWTPEDDARRMLDQAAEAVFGDDVPGWYTSHTVQGRVASVLVDASDRAEILAVGSRGHGGFAGLLLGSVSAECAEHARCPVLVVHGRGAGWRDRGDDDGGRAEATDRDRTER